jgi:hypothetical protein
MGDGRARAAAQRVGSVVEGAAGNALWAVILLAGAAVIYVFRGPERRSVATLILVTLIAVMISIVWRSLWVRCRRLEAMLAEVSGNANEVGDDLRKLRDSLTLLEWTYNEAEHRQEIYRALQNIVEDPRVKHYDVITILNPTNDNISDLTRAAQVDYYKACEKALETRPGFTYSRTLVFRERLGYQKRSDAGGVARELLRDRTHLVEHCQYMLDKEYRSDEVGLKFFFDEGRLVDVALAIALDENRQAIALLVELTLTARADSSAGSRSPVMRQAMGLLTIRQPNLKLRDAFLNVYKSVFDSRVIEKVEDQTMRSVFEGLRRGVQ